MPPAEYSAGGHFYILTYRETRCCDRELFCKAAPSQISGAGAKLFFDAQQLVVFGHAFGGGWVRLVLIWAGIQCVRKIRDGGILCLAGA